MWCVCQTRFVLTWVSNFSSSLLFCSSRPGRPPKRAPVGLTLAATHQYQLKKHRMDNGDYPPYENGHLGGKYHCFNRKMTLFCL